MAAFRENNRTDSERSLIAGILAAYAADKPTLLADLLADLDEEKFASDVKTFATLFSEIKAYPSQAVAILTERGEMKSRPTTNRRLKTALPAGGRTWRSCY